jgi:FkbM family methyltransferase
MRTSRPFVLRILPHRLRQSVWYRFYRPATERHFDLFKFAELAFAPVVMRDLVPGDAISEAIAMTGVYHLKATKWLTRIAKQEGGLLVDVGANLGYFSLLWASLSERNRAVAFEPSPSVFQILQSNVRSNRLADRISARCEAVADRCGKSQFESWSIDQTGHGGMVPDDSPESVTVNLVSLDESLADVPEIAVLKINAQGADALALRGAERLLRERRVRHVRWSENWRARLLGVQDGEAEAFMRRMGYEPIPDCWEEGKVTQWYARGRGV